MHKIIFSIILFISSTYALSQACYSPSSTGVTASASRDGVNVIYDNSSLDSSVVDYAMGQWNGCSGNVPNLSSNSQTSTGPEVHVSLEQGNAPTGKLAKYDITYKSITLYTKDSHGNDIPSSDLPFILMHELGHVFGLDDVAGSNCLMGEGVPSTNEVSTADCHAVVDIWRSEYPCQ